MYKHISQCGVSLCALNHPAKQYMAQHLGIIFTAIGPDFILAEMPVDERTRQPYDLLHGGASMVLAETLGSLASGLLVQDEVEARVTGVDINGSHVRGARDGIVTACCTALKIGRNMHFWQIDIRDQRQRLCCSSRLSVYINRGPAIAGAG